MNLPKLHPRHFAVARAEKEIGLAFWDVVENRNLTYGEGFNLLAELQRQVAASMVDEQEQPTPVEEKPDHAFFWQAARKYDLTYGEAFQILAGLSAQLAKMLVREERSEDSEEEEDE